MKRFNREETNASTVSAQRIYKLGYDATAFEHEITTPHITIPGRRELLRIQDEPMGKLWLSSSKDRAKTKGKGTAVRAIVPSERPTTSTPPLQSGW